MNYVQMQDVGGRSTIYLDLGGDYKRIFAEQDENAVRNILTFPVKGIFRDFPNGKTDKEASIQAATVWRKTFALVNKFFDWEVIGQEEKDDYVRMIVNLAILVRQYFANPENFTQEMQLTLLPKLSKLVVEFDEKYDFFEQLRDFLLTHVEIKTYTHAGERPQDTEEMTFSRDEIVVVTTISMLSKMLMAITILFLNSYKENEVYLSPVMKEVCCLGIFNGILQRNCADVYDKLENFIEKTSKSGDSYKELANYYYAGLSAAIFKHITLATIITKRYASFDIEGSEDNDGKIMTYTLTCSKTTPNTSSNSRFNSSPLDLPKSDKDTMSEDSNGSNLEAEAKISFKTVDYQIIPNSFARNMVYQYIEEFNLDGNMVAEAVKYYTNIRPIRVNKWAAYVLSLEFAHYLVGAASFQLLKADTINRVVPIFQVKMLQQGQTSFIHLATVTESLVEKTPELISGDDIYNQDYWKESISYKNLASRYNFSIGLDDKLVGKNLTWDTGLAKAIDNLTKCKCYYNTAPVLWNALGEDNLNGQLYYAPRHVSDLTCNYILRRLEEYESNYASAS